VTGWFPSGVVRQLGSGDAFDDHSEGFQQAACSDDPAARPADLDVQGGSSSSTAGQFCKGTGARTRDDARKSAGQECPSSACSARSPLATRDGRKVATPMASPQTREGHRSPAASRTAREDARRGSALGQSGRRLTANSPQGRASSAQAPRDAWRQATQTAQPAPAAQPVTGVQPVTGMQATGAQTPVVQAPAALRQTSPVAARVSQKAAAVQGSRRALEGPRISSSQMSPGEPRRASPTAPGMRAGQRETPRVAPRVERVARDGPKATSPASARERKAGAGQRQSGSQATELQAVREQSQRLEQELQSLRDQWGQAVEQQQRLEEELQSLRQDRAGERQVRQLELLAVQQQRFEQELRRLREQTASSAERHQLQPLQEELERMGDEMRRKESRLRTLEIINNVPVPSELEPAPPSVRDLVAAFENRGGMTVQTPPQQTRTLGSSSHSPPSFGLSHSVLGGP